MSVELDTPVLSREDERVLEWRFEELSRAGFPDHLALELALAKAVDLHAAGDLVARGCSPSTASRILL